jgi:hypothetical protein
MLLGTTEFIIVNQCGECHHKRTLNFVQLSFKHVYMLSALCDHGDPLNS